MDKLKPCPKCGRKPKIEVQHSVASVTVIIQCKPLLCDPHARIMADAAMLANAKELARVRWNERADCANLPVW